MALQDLSTDTCQEAPAETQGAGSGSANGPPKWRSTRFCLAYMVSTGLIVLFYQRVSFSMGIVCMVNHTAVRVLHHKLKYTEIPTLNTSLHNGSEIPSDDSKFSHQVIHNRSMTTEESTTTTHIEDDADCHRSEFSTKEKEDGPFAWDKNLQGLLLGALYWGYTVSQVPGSYLIQRKGARLVVGAAIVVMSLCHVLCHPAALLSPWAVFALRVVIGICTGLAIPGMYSVWGRWAPVAERTTLLSIAFAGQMVANASVFPASALLCQYGFWGGWPSIYYVFGLLGLLWCFLWFFIVSDTPETHRRMCPDEKDYIINTRSAVGVHKEKLIVPWRSILTAPCFWAIAVSQFTYNWGFFLMLSNLPIFMHEAMNFDIQSNGAYSMLPYLFLFVTMASAGFISDYVIHHRLLSVVGTRKFFTIVGYLSPAVLLVTMIHQDCSRVGVVVTLLVVAVGLTGLSNTAGFYINPYDIAPRFATNICTATNTMATAAGILNPYVVASITVDETKEQWQVVFYITAAIFAFGTIVFCVFARGEVQPWGGSSAVQETIVEVKEDTGKKQNLCTSDA